MVVPPINHVFPALIIKASMSSTQTHCLTQITKGGKCFFVLFFDRNCQKNLKQRMSCPSSGSCWNNPSKMYWKFEKRFLTWSFIQIHAFECRAFAEYIILERVFGAEGWSTAEWSPDNRRFLIRFGLCLEDQSVWCFSGGNKSGLRKATFYVEYAFLFHLWTKDWFYNTLIESGSRTQSR